MLPEDLFRGPAIVIMPARQVWPCSWRRPYVGFGVTRALTSASSERLVAFGWPCFEYNRKQLYMQAVVPDFPDDFKLAHESYWRSASGIDYTKYVWGKGSRRLAARGLSRGRSTARPRERRV